MCYMYLFMCAQVEVGLMLYNSAVLIIFIVCYLMCCNVLRVCTVLCAVLMCCNVLIVRSYCIVCYFNVL